MVIRDRRADRQDISSEMDWCYAHGNNNMVP